MRTAEPRGGRYRPKILWAGQPAMGRRRGTRPRRDPIGITGTIEGAAQPNHDRKNTAARDNGFPALCGCPRSTALLPTRCPPMLNLDDARRLSDESEQLIGG